MPTNNTIRAVYNWAKLAAPPIFTARDAVGVVPLSYRTIQASLEAMEDMGVAEEGPKGWSITGTLEQLEQGLTALRDDELKQVSGLRPIERVRDVFEYASRCAADGE